MLPPAVIQQGVARHYPPLLTPRYKHCRSSLCKRVTSHSLSFKFQIWLLFIAQNNKSLIIITVKHVSFKGPKKRKRRKIFISSMILQLKNIQIHKETVFDFLFYLWYFIKSCKSCKQDYSKLLLNIRNNYNVLNRLFMVNTKTKCWSK